MAVKVVDASAIAAILFNEPDAPKVVAAIADDALVAPSLLAYELASVCLKKIRLHPDRHDLYRSAMLLFAARCAGGSCQYGRRSRSGSGYASVRV